MLCVIIMAGLPEFESWMCSSNIKHQSWIHSFHSRDERRKAEQQPAKHRAMSSSAAAKKLFSTGDSSSDNDDDDDEGVISRHVWKCDGSSEYVYDNDTNADDAVAAGAVQIIYHLAVTARGHGNRVWNAGACLAEYLLFHRDRLLPSTYTWPPRRTLEFGSGAALPSLALMRDALVNTNNNINNNKNNIDIDIIITDNGKNDAATFAALERSVAENGRIWNVVLPPDQQPRGASNHHPPVISIARHTWGEEIEDFQIQHDCRNNNVQLLLAADCIYNPQYHAALLDSANALIDHTNGLFIVAYSFHSNVSNDAVLHFFTLAKATPYHFQIVRELQHDYPQGQVGIGGTDPARGTVYIKVLAKRLSSKSSTSSFEP
jgi:predicted nicotinamide N-methyase